MRVHDPIASADEARQEYGIELSGLAQLTGMDAVVLAVPHDDYVNRPLEDFIALLGSKGVVVDVKSRLPREELASLLDYLEGLAK